MFTYADLHANSLILNGFKRHEKVELKCNYCSKIYTKTKHHIQRNFYKTNFCTLSCANLSKIKPETKVSCEVCKKDVYRKKIYSENIFCSHTCSAKFSNKNRKRNTPEMIKSKASIRAKLAYDIRNKIKEEMVWGPYSCLFIVKCAHSGELFASRSKRKYSPKNAHLYSDNQRALYIFRFNIFNHKDLFDWDFIKKHGWYSTHRKRNGQTTKANPGGVSRDHRVSVNEAIRNNYDPFYIKHPLNCEIMLHRENSAKKTRSSMSYEDLIKKVDAYEAAKLQ
jgi:hypothetical protein